MISPPTSGPLATLALLVVVITSCGQGAGGQSPAPVDGGGLHTCRELADRWVGLQQAILDELDDPQADRTATDRAAGAMIEQARDAAAVGCSEAVAVGSPLICGRIDQLESGGPRSEAAIADLRSRCEG